LSDSACESEPPMTVCHTIARVITEFVIYLVLRQARLELIAFLRANVEKRHGRKGS
jgi:hypothetical protein